MRRILQALLLLLLALPLAAAAEEDDRGFLTAFLEDSLSGAGRRVTITGFEGALSSRATMRQLTIADDQGIWLTLTDVGMSWSRGALLAGRIEVEELSAAEIVIARAPVAPEGQLPAPEATGFRLPELPVAVNVGALRAGRVVLGEALLGVPAVLRLEGALRLAGGEGSARLVVERIDGAEGRLTLEAGYANATGVLALDLALAEGPEGIAARLLGLPGTPALELAIRGTGPLADYGADIALATGGAERLRGRVTLRAEAPDADGQRTRRFRAELGGDVAALLAPDYAAFFGPESRLLAEGTAHADGRIEIPALSLSAAAMRLRGALRIGADGLPAFFDLEGEIAAPDGGPVLLPLPGRPTRVERVTLALAFDAARGPDWTGSAGVTGLARPGLGLARLQLEGSGRILREAEGARVRADLRFDAGGIALADPALAAAVGPVARGRLLADWQEGRPVVLPGLRLDGEGYGLSAAVTLGGLPFAIDGRGLLRIDDMARFGPLAGLELGGAGFASVQGRFEPASGATDAALTLAGRGLRLGIAELDGLLAGDSRLAVDLRRDAGGTTLRSLSLEAAALSASGSGRITRAGASFAGQVAMTDLSVLGPRYGGSAEARVDIRPAGGEGAGEELRLSLRARGLRLGQAELDSLLAGESRIDFEGRRAGARVGIDRLELAAATLRLSATGHVGREDSALRARLELADLAALGGPWRGALEATAEAAEAGGVQTLLLQGEGRGLGLGIPEADRLLSGTTRLAADLRRAGGATDLRWARLEAGPLVLRLTGRLQPGASDLAADLALADLAALGPGYGGALSGEARLIETGALRRLTLRGIGRNLRPGAAAAEPLLRGETRLALEAEEEGGAIRLRSLTLANPQLEARAEGEAGGGAAGRLALSARLADLALLAPEFPGPVTLEGVARESPGGYDLTLAAQGPGGIDARLGGRLASDLAEADLTLTGRAELALLNGLLLPRSVQGPVGFELALRGPLAPEGLSGRITAAGARLVDPTYGVTLAGLALDAALSGGRARLEAQAEVEGGGRVVLSGPVALAAPYAGELSLRLEGARITDPALYDTRASGTLSLTGPLAGGARIAGAITLDETEISIPSTGLGGAGPIPELRHLAEPAAVRATRARAGLIAEGTESAAPARRPYALALSISAPRRIFVRGRGLDAELGGGLELTGTTDAVVPIGGFSLIRGRLDLLGRRFQLTEGQAQLQGRFMPYLRLAATTEAEGIAVAIEIEGEAGEPAIRIRSTPELPEEEVLARLLFGRGIENISALQAAQLASAVATLAGRGGEGVVGRLRRGFGLDDLDLSTDAAGGASVRAGKYLSENLYTDITLGSDGRSTVSLNLDVTPALTLRGRLQSDGNSAIGLFFERDY